MLAMLGGPHHLRLLVHANLQDIIRDWLGGLRWKASTRVTVDVDPYSFL